MASSKVINLHLLVVIISIILPVLGVSKSQVPCYFIFGDSLVDNGNNNHLNTSSKANYLPYGIDFPSGSTGRFTNGRNLVDFIAELLGFEEPIPPFSTATYLDVLRGLNYASGGAGILDQSGLVFGEVLGLNKQLSSHGITVSRVAKILGGKRAAKKHLSKCLYTVGMGNNDYLANFLPQLYASVAQYTPLQFADLLIAQYSKQLRRLYNYGARKVAVFGVGRLGCVPQQLTAYGTTPDSICFDTTNNIVDIFNKKLKLLIDDLNGALPKAEMVYARDVSDDASYSYGNITILTSACCGTRGDSMCVAGSVPCSNRDEYYFWDDVHPTQAAFAITANIAYTYISPLLLNANDIVVPLASY